MVSVPPGYVQGMGIVEAGQNTWRPELSAYPGCATSPTLTWSINQFFGLMHPLLGLFGNTTMPQYFYTRQKYEYQEKP